MTTFVSPQGNQQPFSILATTPAPCPPTMYKDKGYGHLLLSDQIHDSAHKNIMATYESGHRNLDATHTVGHKNLDATHSVGHKNLDATHSVGHHLKEGICDLKDDVYDAERGVKQKVDTAISSADKHYHKLDEAVSDVDRDVHETSLKKMIALKDLAIDNARDHGKLSRHIAKDTCEILKETGKDYAKLSKQSAKEKGSLSKQLEEDACEVKGVVGKIGSKLMKQNCDLKYSLSKQAAEDACEIKGVVGKVGSKLMKQGFEAQKQSAKQACKTQKELAECCCKLEKEIIKSRLKAAKQTYKLEKQACENFSAAQLLAVQNKECLSKQLSDCCCKLEGKVEETAAKTQKLIEKTETQRLRDELAQCQQEKLLLQSNPFDIRGATARVAVQPQ